MQTPVYEASITIGGSSQSRTFDALPSEMITNQSGEIRISHYDADTVPFDISGLAGTALKAVPVDTDVTPVTMATGSVTYESEKFTLTSALVPSTSGTFTLTVAGETTSGIAFNASASVILAALDALASRTSGDFEVKKISGTNLGESGTVIKVETSGSFSISSASLYDGSGLNADPSIFNVTQNASDVLNTYRAIWGKDTIPESWSAYIDRDGPIAITIELDETAANDTNDDYYQSYQQISVRDKSFKSDGATVPEVFFDYTWLTAESVDWNKFNRGTPTTLVNAVEILAGKGINDWGKVINLTEVTAPLSPSAGDSYIAAGVGGDWSAFATNSQITRNSLNDAWVQRVPSEGDTIYDLDTLAQYKFTSSAWVSEAVPQTTDDLTEGSTNLYFTDARVEANSAVTANTNRTVITAQQATDITTNNAKTGISVAQSNEITANTAKTGITAQQALDIEANKFTYTTGVLTGGDVIAGTSSTQITVTAGTGVIINWTNPASPIKTSVIWSQQTDIEIPDLSKLLTEVSIDVTGTVVLASMDTGTTPTDRRTQIQLQTAVHTSGVQVDSIGTSKKLAYDMTEAIYDYIQVNGTLNTGNNYVANGANLNINKNSGTTTVPWINQSINPMEPATKTDPAINIGFLITSWRDGVGGFNQGAPTTLIDPDNYDDASGTLASMPNNQWQNQRIYWFSNNTVAGIIYGQTTYGSQADAIDAIQTEAPAVTPIAATGAFTTVLTVQEGATDLSNIAQAKFTVIVTNKTGVTATGLEEPLDSLRYINSSVPSTPTTGETTLYIDTADKKLKSIDDTGTIRDMTESAAAVDTTSVNNWTGQQNFSNGNLTDAASITWDLDLKQVTSVTLAGNRTLANPTNPVTHGTYILKVIQDGTGSRTLGFGSAYKWPNDIAPTIGSAANSVTVMTFIEQGGFMLGSDIKSYNL